MTGTFCLALLVWAVLVIQDARRAVSKEIDATARLSLQLLELALGHAARDARPALLQEIHRLETAYHLRIELVERMDHPLNPQVSGASSSRASAPAWFVRLVEPERLSFRRGLSAPSLAGKEIVVTPDPADEIAEAWKETRSLLAVLAAFFLGASVLVFVTIGRALRPVEAISRALAGIERGDYQVRLPRIALPELEAIARNFNHMAEVLGQSQEDNRRLTQRNLAIQEQERRHLAGELHDEMGQSISAIKALAVSIRSRREGIDLDARDKLTSIVDICNRVYDVARGMMRRLRPVILDELGLLPALEEMVDDWNSRHGDTFCGFFHDGRWDDLSDDLKINLYRMIQEGLTNVSKHARASRVEVRLQRATAPDVMEQVTLTIDDNGVGADPQRSLAPGLGLFGMRERAQALGGTFEWTAEPGRGVKVRVVLPVKTQGDR
jgi:two-component system sensor histidine kinase UhpB